VASPSPNVVARFKPVLLDYDRTIVDGDKRECSFCLTLAEAEALIAVGSVLSWVTRWYSPSNTLIDPDETDAFASDIARRLMSGCCGSGDLVRVTSDGSFEYSSDGGETWYSDDTRDPRNGIVQPPSLPGDDGADKKCQAANNGTTVLENNAEAIAQGLETNAKWSDFVAIFIGLLLVFGIIGAVGWVMAFLGALIGMIWANFNAAQWREAFDEDFWQAVLCAIYCNLQENGQFNAEGHAACIAQIEEDLEDTAPRMYVTSYIRAGGWQGMNVIMQSGGGDRSCDACCGVCNLDDWQVQGDLGVETDRGDDYVQVQAEQNVDNKYYILLGTHSPTPTNTSYDGPCCTYVSKEFVGSDPGGTQDSIVLCGDDYDHITTGLIGGQCGWLVQFRNDNPFEIKIFISDGC